MPHVDPSIFGRHERFDKKPGYQNVVPTTQKYVEEDGTDVRVYRIYIYEPNGSLSKTLLRDTLGVLFSDIKDIPDDPGYLESFGLPPERR